MNRKEFLSGLGIAGVGSMLPGQLLKAKTAPPSPPFDCVLIPSETAGPFPLDLTENETFFRQDVREDQTGVQLNLKLKIIGLENCEPMQNVRVNIWHCDKDGVYSGYSTGNNPGDSNATYLRGYQFADANGEVEFITIVPGWYSGRICHIHFQVYVSSSYSAISQLSFPIETKNAIYEANSELYTKGDDPLSFQQDNIFSDGYEYQLSTLTANEETGGYDAYLEVAVQGEGTVGLGHLERQAAKQFTLGQNFPNPYTANTTIPFTLVRPASVTLELWELSGRRVYSMVKENMATGDHQIPLELEALDLPVGNYVYQMTVSNSEGQFTLCKMMTAG
ncbi:MAG: hypothetical protein KDD15_33590 [Lewinella sp.]|nr:hypothetical protein [Lewinella sp.]